MEAVSLSFPGEGFVIPRSSQGGVVETRGRGFKSHQVHITNLVDYGIELSPFFLADVRRKPVEGMSVI